MASAATRHTETSPVCAGRRGEARSDTHFHHDRFFSVFFCLFDFWKKLRLSTIPCEEPFRLSLFTHPKRVLPHARTPLRRGVTYGPHLQQLDRTSERVKHVTLAGHSRAPSHPPKIPLALRPRKKVRFGWSARLSLSSTSLRLHSPLDAFLGPPGGHALRRGTAPPRRVHGGTA
jgi:hypothetical protein